MLFHFEFRGSSGWEPIGAGVGNGDDPIAEALAEVRRFAGGTLPEGRYQVIQARSSVTRWEAFDLSAEGEVSDPGEPVRVRGSDPEPFADRWVLDVDPSSEEIRESIEGDRRS